MVHKVYTKYIRCNEKQAKGNIKNQPTPKIKDVSLKPRKTRNPQHNKHNLQH